MNVRESVIATWGPMWEASPLLPQVVAEEAYQGCVLRYVRLQSSPGVFVPGTLVIPPSEKRNGHGILCVHQHAGEWHLGKSEPIGKKGNPNMFYALELAARGYVTFTIDLLAFEERGLPVGMDSKLDGSGYERYEATKLIMYGQTLKGRYVWDLHRAADFMLSLPEVSSERLGAIGHSLGGQSVLDLMIYDERISAGVCSCGIGTWETILRDGIIHNMAAYAPGMLQVADTDKLVSVLVPRPFFMSSGDEDRIFPIDGVRHIGEVAAAAYRLAGAPEHFVQKIFPGGHGFPPDVRAEAYDWLDRWLL